MSRVVVAGCVLLLGTFAFAQPAPLKLDPELEKQFRAEVAAVSADAATAFDEGNAARDANRGDDAIKAYRHAIELAPKVDHPHRRLCGVLAATGQADEAVTECEAALSLAPSSPYDKAALSSALIVRNHADERGRAYDLARAAAEAVPNDVHTTAMWCRAALTVGNPLGISTCSDRFIALDPDGMDANSFAAMSAVYAHDFDDAHRRLAKSKAAGLDPAAFEALSKLVDDEEKRYAAPIIDVDAVIEPGLLTLCLWALVMLVLFLVGLALSNATLRTVETTSTLEGDGTARERRLRKIYKAVLLLCGLFFYASMPLMLITVIASACFAVYVLDEMGAIPIFVLWLLGVMIFATFAGVLRSLFVRAEPDPPGQTIDLSAYPKLRALLDEVAEVVGTRPVDAVYLVPGTTIAVTERTGLLRTLLRRPSERKLFLGVAQFDGMTQLQLRAILAHEYGHFRNQDTAGGGFALAVRRSLRSLVLRLAKAGANHFYNPMWWFVRAFWRMYLGISQGASRLQEVLADRWAVRAYGSAAFTAGYRHVVARNVEFDADLDAKIKEIMEHEWSLPNLYNYEPERKQSPEELAAAIDKEMKREPTDYDSHPSSRQRIEWAGRLDVHRAPQPGDDATVWQLFPEPEQIEREMTALVREEIRVKFGILVSGEDDEPDADLATDAPAAAEPSTAPP